MGKTYRKYIKDRGVFEILVAKLIEKFEESIRMDLKEIGINRRNWVKSAQDRGYWRAFVECGIGPPCFISYGVS